MTRFSTAAHLVSWAKFAPAVHESAGTKKPRNRPKGNPWLAATLGNAAGALTRSNTFLGARYRRIARRRGKGKGKAMVAVGNSMLTIVWHLLSDPTASFEDLGADYYETRINPERRARNLAAALEAVTGQKIVIRNNKAIIIETAAAGPNHRRTRLRSATPGRCRLPIHRWIFGQTGDGPTARSVGQ